jgi:hypothetical protein
MIWLPGVLVAESPDDVDVSRCAYTPVSQSWLEYGEKDGKNEAWHAGWNKETEGCWHCWAMLVDHIVARAAGCGRATVAHQAEENNARVAEARRHDCSGRTTSGCDALIHAQPSSA